MNRKGFSKMLVPIDGSEGSIKAANLAMDIAKKYGMQVTVLHVVNINQYTQALDLYRISYPDPVKRMVEKTKQEAARWFAEVQKEAETSGVSVAAEVINTPLSVVGTIVNHGERDQSDLIVIGTRGRSGLTKLLLGSVASGAVSYAPCPVLVAK